MKRSNGQFAKYLSRNLLIAAIVSSLLVPIYFVSLKSVRKNEVQSVYSDFETGFTQMDGTLEKLIDLSNLMVNNASISRLIHIDGEMQVRDYALLPQASSFVSSSIVSDDLVVNAYILSSKNSIFLSNSMVSEDRGKIYGTFYSIDGYDSQSWLKAVFKNRKGFFFLPDAVANWNFDVPERQKRHDTLHLVVPAPTAAGRSTQCAVVYMLNTEKLFEFFRSRNLSDKTFVYPGLRTQTSFPIRSAWNSPSPTGTRLSPPDGSLYFCPSFSQLTRRRCSATPSCLLPSRFITICERRTHGLKNPDGSFWSRPCSAR